MSRASTCGCFITSAIVLIGLTGTPERLDGKPLGDVWDEMVEGPSVAWLIERGFLSKYRAYAPKGLVDTSQLHTRAGEFVQAEVEALMEGKAVIAGAGNLDQGAFALNVIASVFGGQIADAVHRHQTVELGVNLV